MVKHEVSTSSVTTSTQLPDPGKPRLFMWLVPSLEVSKTRRLVSGPVFRYVCVIFLKKRKGGEGREVYFHVVHGKKVGLVLGKGAIPLGRHEQQLQKDGKVSRLGHKNTMARKVGRLQSAKIPCSTLQSAKGKIKSE